MTEQQRAQWERFKKYYLYCPEIGLALDVSRMHFEDGNLMAMEPAVRRALEEMQALEKGAIANRDENRMVGHYWLRNPQLAPRSELAEAIEANIARIEHFAQAVSDGTLRGVGGRFEKLLVIGIGGSALGPQFVSRALARENSGRPELYFIDNTDPDGIDVTMAQIGDKLAVTLCLVISKSGGTRETRNAMLEVMHRFEDQGLRFQAQAVAVTGEGSELDTTAETQGWLARFPMWDWVGGRTSELSAVGLLPAAIQGINIRELLRGAAACDQLTRRSEVNRNPAVQLASMWYLAGNGKGSRDLVVLPYKDRLELFAKYLQQLIMESLGKERNRDGSIVNQGIAVYGNKGSTDQHAYVQQLRDGINNFFVTFINVLKCRNRASIEVDAGVSTGDYLNGFFMGTREALHQNGRQSVTLTLECIDDFRVGALIALFERAVGIYACLVNVNAYNQPGVEAGKKAAAGVLTLQSNILGYLTERAGVRMTAAEMASGLGSTHSPEDVFLVCRHLAATRMEILENICEPIWNSNFYHK